MAPAIASAADVPLQAPDATTPSETTTEAVADPTHDRERHRRRAAVGGTFLVLGTGAAATAGALAHLSLSPRCTDPNDVLTCEVPDGSDLRRRAGMLGGGATVSIAAAIMAGLGTRGLLRNTGLDLSLAARTRRRTALGIAGGTAIVVGTAGLVTGAALAGVGLSRVTASTQPQIDPTDVAGSQRAVMHDVDARLHGLALARTGLAVAFASPAVLAIGVALVRHRPSLADDVRIAPQVSRTQVGVSVRGRF